MSKTEIREIEYQQGTLQGYAIHEYLLEKWVESVLTAEKVKGG